MIHYKTVFWLNMCAGFACATAFMFESVWWKALFWAFCAFYCVATASRFARDRDDPSDFEDDWNVMPERFRKDQGGET